MDRDLEFARGARRPEPRKPVSKPQVHERGIDGERHPLLRALPGGSVHAHLLRRVADDVEGIGQAPRIVRRLFGELNLPEAALEQLHAQRLLERANVTADGRWREPQLLRCLLEAEQPRRGLERANGIERRERHGAPAAET